MKKLVIILVLAAFISAGAFAQGLGFGLSVNQYYMEDADGNLPSLGDAWTDFKEGNGRYWGGFAELMGRQAALGLSFHFMVDEGEISAYDMWNYDVNLYLSYHILGTKSVIDPFLQAGFGLWAYDYMNKDELRVEEGGWTISDDPLMGAAYFDLGFGLGLNFGSLGIFTKCMYNFQSKDPLYGEDNVEIFELPVMPLKWTFGAKILL